MTNTITGKSPNEIEVILDCYTELRERCYKAAKANDGELMGNDAWLRSAMSENNLNLSFGGDGITCYGTAYSMQTMSHAQFYFDIPFSALNDQD